MLRRSLTAIFALAFSSSIAWGCGENGPANAAKPEIGYVEIDPEWLSKNP